ncbi:MAG TPA: enoyl-CoA hydratase/isomerase family protein, partial [Myxococcota bacterium]
MRAHLRISDIVVDDTVVRVLTLDHVARRNALTPELLAAIPAALPSSSASPTQPIRAVILEGAASTFSSGFDLRAIDGEKHTGVDPITVAADAIAACPVPVVAAVEGACRGGAVELLAACHVRVAAADATFAVPAVHLGLVYPTSGLRRFRRVLGAAAERVLLVGRAFSAADARGWGLVHDVVADARS